MCGITYTILDERKERLERMGVVHPAVVCNECANRDMNSLDIHIRYYMTALLGSPVSRAMMREGNLEGALEKAESTAMQRLNNPEVLDPRGDR